MTHIQSISRKNTSFKLSEQVKETLHARGYSAIFNYQDYKYYKAQVKKAFNKAQAIAELFINDNLSNNRSDFQEYIF
jgi:hypothetical protein